MSKYSLKNQPLSVKTHAIISMFTAGSLLSLTSAASAVTLKVSVTNLAPANGTLLTPTWFGFHNGNFDLYDNNVSLNLFPGMEDLVEDGNTAPISNRFTNENAGIVQGTILGTQGANAGPIDSGETASILVEVDPNLPTSRFFSYASMVIPSNDAFIANGDQMAYRIFDDSGNFQETDFIVSGSQVLDGGTEVNDELPANTAFFGQNNPDTGVDENGLVGLHPGFNAIGTGGILDDPQFSNADFKVPGYQVARIQVQVVPEPSTVIGLLTAVGSAFFLKNRRRMG
ncbi:MAG TPA: PEP-CTERM sorting domain-containing protein [Cyanothece sp. UBA12306]|nr:PEP-CTERM sorting domain-containing protein [Cyanothece sp. UBA12306]